MAGVRGMNAAAIAIAVLLVAGCAADEPDVQPSAEPSIPTPVASEPSASPSESPSSEPSASAEPSAEPSTQPSPEPSATTAPLAGIRLDLACDRVLTAQDLYEYNPNVGPDPGYRARSGSGPAMAVELSGTACGLLNQTSTQTYSIGIARFDADNLERIKRAAANTGGEAGDLGMEGYYRTEAGLGVVEAFTGPYWITAESSAFLEPGDVAPLLDAIARNLP